MPLKASVWPSIAPRIAPCSVHTISAVAVQLVCDWPTVLTENTAITKAAVPDMLNMRRRFIAFLPRNWRVSQEANTQTNATEQGVQQICGSIREPSHAIHAARRRRLSR